MNRYFQLPILFCALCLITIGCKGNTHHPNTSHVTVLMGVTAAGTLPHMVNKVVFTVTGTDMNTIVQESVVPPGSTVISETLYVPNGLSRSFLFEIKDSLGTLLYQGTAGPIDLDGTPVPLDNISLQAVIFAGTKQLGTLVEDDSNGIATDSSGNIYVVGTAYSADMMSSQVVLTKFNEFGITVWKQSLGPSDTYSFGYGVAVDGTGNALITGATGSSIEGTGRHLGGIDSFIAKYDPAGTLTWIDQFGSITNDFSRAIAVDAAGNAYITGYTDGSIDGNVNAGGYDAFMVKYDPSGSRMTTETKLIGDAGDDYSDGIAVDGSGNFAIAGSTEGLLAGAANAGMLDLFAAMYDSSGTRRWIQQKGTFDLDQAWGVAMDPTGNVFIAGWTFSGIDGNSNPDQSGDTADAVIMKFDTAGALVWTQQIGSAVNDIANSIAADASGNIYVTGGTLGTLNAGSDNSGMYDVFLAKYDTNGTKQWMQQRGSAADDEGMAIAVDSQANLLVTGYTYGGLDGNNNPDSTGTTSDFFLMKFDPNGDKQ